MNQKEKENLRELKRRRQLAKQLSNANKDVRDLLQKSGVGGRMLGDVIKRIYDLEEEISLYDRLIKEILDAQMPLQ